MIRNFFSLILLLTASQAAFLGTVLHWANHVAHDPEPAQLLAEQVVQDEAVANALAAMIQERIESQLPESADSVPGLSSLISTGIDSALKSPEVRAAWEQAINESRAALVSDLAAYRESARVETPSLWFDLAPFADIVRDHIVASANAELQPMLDEIELPADTRVEVTKLSTSYATIASDGLAAASLWWVGYVAAAVLLLLGLLLGTGATRWVWLTLAALAPVLIVAVALTQFHYQSPGGSNVVSAFTMTAIKQLTSSLTDWMNPFWYGCWALAAFGLVAAIIVTVRRRAKT